MLLKLACWEALWSQVEWLREKCTHERYARWVASLPGPQKNLNEMVWKQWENWRREVGEASHAGRDARKNASRTTENLVDTCASTRPGGEWYDTRGFCHRSPGPSPLEEVRAGLVWIQSRGKVSPSKYINLIFFEESKKNILLFVIKYSLIRLFFLYSCSGFNETYFFVFKQRVPTR